MADEAAKGMSSGTGPVRNVRNVLFIMCDQLRFDHLSCYVGAAAVPTPNIDRLAKLGTRFDNAYVASAVCGPSRTSFYTGRYPVSHRVTWNRVPMPLDELSLGHYLAPAGLTCDLLGKTHFVPDREGLKRMGYEPQGEAFERYAQGGFHPIERYDGHFEMEEGSPYRDYLKAKGYAGERPWTDYVIGSHGADGQPASGWYLRNAPLPSRVREEDSETAYLTTRAIDYIERKGDQPWALHLSYIKPHWPYKAPAPYHAMYSLADCQRPVRDERERRSPHPVHAAYQRQEESQSFARDEVWQAIRPVYRGLVKQIDDHIGRLLACLEHSGRLEDTLIVFTADHGDHLGDHWLGEKEYFFEAAVKVPFLLYDPGAAQRGTSVADWIECVDVVPTVLEALGIAIPDHRIEGASLLPFTRQGGAPEGWRGFAISQLDYAYREARQFLGRDVSECNAFMVREGRHKLIHWQGYAPQLFDLVEDPGELHDLGGDEALAPVRRCLQGALFEWLQARKGRATETYAQARDRTHAHERMMNILIGRW